MRNTDRTHSPTHFTSHRAARILQVSKKTLHNWVNSGKVSKPATNPENGYLLWTMGDIDAIRIELREKETGQ
jgi:DNA-binding transcriptional MerR regulator